VLVDTIVTLKLNPTGQPPTVCSNDDLGIPDRQGASTGIFMFTLLSFAAFVRRRVKK
jgi:hypothetical protein